MNADMFVVRHAQSGAPHLIAQHLNAHGRTHVHVVNAGDGRHAHPTQGLLDLYTIRHYKQRLPRADGRDRRRRAALARRALADPRADHARHAGGARDRAARRCCPPRVEALGVRVFHDMREGLARLRRRGDAAPAERAHEGRAAAVGGRVLQALRPHAGQARAGQARRDRHAPGADEPRRRDRLGGRRRRARGDPAAGDVRHRRADGGDEHDRRA